MNHNDAKSEPRLYYEDCPRGFCNEYTIYAVRRSQADRFEEVFPNAVRITRKEAIRRGITRVNEAHRDGEQWYGGLAGRAWLPADSTEEKLADAESATMEEVNLREMLKEENDAWLASLGA